MFYGMRRLMYQIYASIPGKRKKGEAVWARRVWPLQFEKKLRAKIKDESDEYWDKVVKKYDKYFADESKIGVADIRKYAHDNGGR